MSGVYPVGMDWLEADYLLKNYNIQMSPLLLEKLQLMEGIQIDLVLERGEK